MQNLNKNLLVSLLQNIGTEVDPLNLQEFANTHKVAVEKIFPVLELLDIFNAIEFDNTNVFAVNETAQYFLQSLALYLKNDAKIFSSWETIALDKDNFYNNLKSFGINFLRLIEDKRVNALNIKETFKTDNLVLIIIKVLLQDGGEVPYYLYQYNLKTTQFQTLGGYKEPNETRENSALRHLKSELELTNIENSNVKLTFLPDTFVKYGVSMRNGVYTKYEIELCLAEFALDQLKLTGLDRWLSIEEIEKGITLDGIQIMSLPKDRNDTFSYLDTLVNSLEKPQKNLSTNSPLYNEKNQELNFTAVINKYLQSEESEEIEFKSSSRWDYRENKINKELEKVVAKSIAAFMNSSGGVLMIGVNDEKEVLGLDNDIQTLNKKNEDGYVQHIIALITHYIGIEYASFVSIFIEKPEDKSVCVLKIRKAPKPVFVKNNENRDFYVRIANTSRQLNTEDSYKYIQLNW